MMCLDLSFVTGQILTKPKAIALHFFLKIGNFSAIFENL